MIEGKSFLTCLSLPTFLSPWRCSYTLTVPGWRLVGSRRRQKMLPHLLNTAARCLTAILPGGSKYMLLVIEDRNDFAQYITTCTTREELVIIQREVRDLIATHDQINFGRH